MKTLKQFKIVFIEIYVKKGQKYKWHICIPERNIL